MNAICGFKHNLKTLNVLGITENCTLNVMFVIIIFPVFVLCQEIEVMCFQKVASSILVLSFETVCMGNPCMI